MRAGHYDAFSKEPIKKEGAMLLCCMDNKRSGHYYAFRNDATKRTGHNASLLHESVMKLDTIIQHQMFQTGQMIFIDQSCYMVIIQTL